LLKTLLPKAGLQSVIRLVLSFGSGNRTNTEKSDGKSEMHPCIISATSDLINPTSVGNVLYMAYTELIQVRFLSHCNDLKLKGLNSFFILHFSFSFWYRLNSFYLSETVVISS
jgi:hypothetical protein